MDHNIVKLNETKPHDGRVMVERSDRMWSTGEENGKPLQYSCLENPINSMKRQKDRTLKDDLPMSVGHSLQGHRVGHDRSDLVCIDTTFFCLWQLCPSES